LAQIGWQFFGMLTFKRERLCERVHRARSSPWRGPRRAGRGFTFAGFFGSSGRRPAPVKPEALSPT